MDTSHPASYTGAISLNHELYLPTFATHQPYWGHTEPYCHTWAIRAMDPMEPYWGNSVIFLIRPCRHTCLYWVHTPASHAGAGLGPQCNATYPPSILGLGPYCHTWFAYATYASSSHRAIGHKQTDKLNTCKKAYTCNVGLVGVLFASRGLYSAMLASCLMGRRFVRVTVAWSSPSSS